MSTFDLYAAYYDLLYRDKDYKAEAHFVARLISQWTSGKRILELGCGTGLHALALNELGYDVVGVDLSPEMVQQANARMGAQNPAGHPFVVGDVRTFRAPGRFDAVISLFHVMSYQTSNDDLSAAISTASAHLDPGGVFVFDAWYGPAVLSQRPTVRIKRVEDDLIDVVRIAEPVVHQDTNVVDVNYTIIVTDKNTAAVHRVTECHPMRYFFVPEMTLMLSLHGLKLMHVCDWLDIETRANSTTWAATFIAVKI